MRHMGVRWARTDSRSHTFKDPAEKPPLLQGNHRARRCPFATYDNLQRNIAGAQTCWNCEVELIQTCAGQARKSQRHVYVFHEKCHRVGGMCGAGK